jgi:hypothetical protein
MQSSISGSNAGKMESFNVQHEEITPIHVLREIISTR